ncbi:MAG: hypothetical protein ACI3ZC_01940 [Candidatus Cryptobacteroides sp.]
MKTLRYFAALAAAASVLFSGCSDDEPKEKEIVFPETQEVSINIDETKNLSFTADADWKLSIDKPWLVFVDDLGNHVPQLSGVVGQSVVTITTTDVTAVFETETATIDITMKDKTQTIYTVTRQPRERQATMWLIKSKTEIVPIESLDFEYGSSGVSFQRIYFTANFDWTVKSAPEWMNLELFSDVAADEVEYASAKYAGVNEEFYPYEQTGVIVLSDQKGEHEFEFPVSYAGMGTESLSVKNGSRTIMTNNKGASFSFDGFVMSNEYTPKPTEETSVTWTIQTKDLKYQTLVLQEYDKMNMGNIQWWANPSWVKTESAEAGSLTISVEANDGDARVAYVLIVPEGMIPEGTTLNQAWFRQNKDTFIGTEYMIPVAQEAAPKADGGFIVGWSTTKVETIKFSDYSMFAGMNPSDLRYGLPNDNTWVVELTDIGNSYSLQVAPLGFPEDWMTYANGSADSPLFKLISFAGSWPNDNTQFSQTYVYETSTKYHKGISYKKAAFNEVQSGSIGILVFMKDETETQYNPSAALILIKL